MRKSVEDLRDENFEHDWIERMSPHERSVYLARRKSYRPINSELTHAEWIEYGKINARDGEQAATAYVDAIRRARFKRATVERVGMTSWQAVGMTCYGLFLRGLVTVGLAWPFGHAALLLAGICLALFAVLTLPTAYLSRKPL